MGQCNSVLRSPPQAVRWVCQSGCAWGLSVRLCLGSVSLSGLLMPLSLLLLFTLLHEVKPRPWTKVRLKKQAFRESLQPWVPLLRCLRLTLEFKAFSPINFIVFL